MSWLKKYIVCIIYWYEGGFFYFIMCLNLVWNDLIIKDSKIYEKYNYVRKVKKKNNWVCDFKKINIDVIKGFF